jgi:hypothetical protein
MKSFQNKTGLIYFIVCLLFFSINVAGQEDEHDHDHLHDVHKYHLGVGIAGTYLTGEQLLAPGIDLHILRQLGEKQNWGMGLGYEIVFKENIHNNISLMGNVHPVKFLAINAGPGFTFGKHDNEMEFSPALHAEAVFEFDINKIHIGPVAGFGIDKEESHYSLGVHVGYGF